MAIIFIGAAWTLSSTPTGWTANDSNATGTNWFGYTLSKVLLSTDIAAGSVTFSFSGSYDVYTAIVTLVGSTGGIREVDSSRTSGGVGQVMV